MFGLFLQNYTYSNTVNWLGTTITLSVALLILLLFAYMIYISTTDSNKHSEFKQYLDALLGGTPSKQDKLDEITKRTAAERLSRQLEPFEEACPACGGNITHKHIDCPSCGLRLL